MQGNPTSDNLDRCFEPTEYAVKLAINQAPCPFFFGECGGEVVLLG